MGANVERDEARETENTRMLRRLTVVAVLMFGFGFAMVPFYQRICQALGINYLIKPDEAYAANTQIDVSRSITIEFDGNTHNMPWKFRPMVNHMSVHPGELATVVYEVSNTSAVSVTGQAVPSYGPTVAGRYFKKVECFCFTQQTLGGGEARRMPVMFVVDPALPRDVNTITLSYTFFEVPGVNARS